MADEDARVKRGEAMWKRFSDLVPPEKLAAPVPKPQAAPVPPPVAAPTPSEEAKVRDIQMQILKDRQTEDRKRFNIERDAQQDAFESMQRLHEIQKKMGP